MLSIPHVTLLALVLAFAAQAPQPPAGLPQAMARINAGDPAGGLAIAEAVVAREPGNARAWRVLGLATRATKDFDRSLAAFQKSVELEPSNPAGLYNTGAIYALKGDK